MSDNLLIQRQIAHLMTIFCIVKAVLVKCIVFFGRLSDIGVVRRLATETDVQA